MFFKSNIGSFYQNDFNHGSITIQTSIPSRKSEKSIDCIFEEMSELKENLQDEKIIERIKKRKVYNCLKLFGTNEGRSKIIHFVIDDDLTTEKYLTKINEITPENIREAAIKYLPDKNGNYVLLLRDPLKNKY